MMRHWRLPRLCLGWRSFLVTFWLIVPPFSYAAESAKVEGNEFYMVTKVKGDFDEVVDNITKEIKLQNFFVTGITDVDEGIQKRKGPGGKTAFEHYKIIGFCSLTLAEKAISVDPNVGVFMPCRLLVYQLVGNADITIATMRPTFMAKVFRDPQVEALAKEVEQVVLKIFEAAEGF